MMKCVERSVSGGCALALVLAFTGSLGCKKEVAEAKPAETSAPPGEAWISEQQIRDASILVEPAAEQAIHTTVVSSARITFDDLHVSHVFTPVTGRVIRIDAQLGQKVKKGDPLCAIQSPDLGQASSDLGKAQADLTAAEHDFKRKKDLYESHAGSQADLEAAEDNFGKAKAEMERAKQKAILLRAGSVDLVTSSYVLRSLIDGEVLMRTVNPGMEVQGQYGGGSAVELFTIGELDPVWALADVYEVDLARVKAGAKVTLNVVSYPGRTFDGTVDWVQDVLDPTTRTAKVRCTLPNKERLLKPEMYATAYIAVSGRSALAIRRTAVVHIGEQTVVYMEAGKAPNGRIRFVRKPVQVDEREPGEFVPVLNGVAPGDKLVMKNAILVSES